MKLEKMQKRMGEIVSRLEEFQNMSNEAWTPELRSERDTLISEGDGLRTDMKALHEMRKLGEFAQAEPETETRDLPKVGNIEVRDALVYAEPKTSIGQQLADIAARTMPHKFNSKSVQAANARLERSQNRLRNIELRTADPNTQQESVYADGGIFLEMTREMDMIEVGYNKSAIVSRCQRRTMAPMTSEIQIYGMDTSSRKDGTRNGGVSWVPMDELEAVTRSKVSWENRITIKPRKMGAGYNASEEIVRDVAMLTGEINSLFMDELAFALDVYAYEGVGGLEPMVGFKNSPAALTVPKFGTQGAGTFVWENLIAMKLRMHAPNWPNAVWYYNKELEQQFYQIQIPTGDSAMLVNAFQPGRTSEEPATLMGRPAIPIEQADVPGTKGDICLVDPSQFIVTNKGGMTSAVSADVNFWEGQWAYRFTMYVDGQCRWTKPVTPYKGTTTTSPIIFLAERA